MLRDLFSRVFVAQEWQPPAGDIVPAAPNDLQRIGVPFAPERVEPGHEVMRRFGHGDMQRLTIALSHLVRLPIKRLCVLERYHRIFLVAYEPFGQLDPVLPLTAVPLGDSHNSAYAALSDLIHGWQPEGELDYGASYHASFYHQAERQALVCAQAAFQWLEPDEANYYATELMYSVAYPRRKYGHF